MTNETCIGLFGRIFGHKFTTGPKYNKTLDYAYCKRCGETSKHPDSQAETEDNQTS